MKRSFFVGISLLVFGTVVFELSSSIVRPSRLSKRQSEQYIEEILATLFGPHYDARFDEQKITRKTLKQLDKGGWWWSSSSWTSQEVYDAVVNCSIKHVEKQAFNLAKEQTGSPEVTNNIVERVRNEMLGIIARTDEFQIGALQQYIGTNLAYTVYNMSHQYEVPWQQLQCRTDEVRCRQCHVSFARGIRWVYLWPCGHDMCVSCANNYFLFWGNQRCPACNQFVDIHVLRAQLSGPTMPS